MMVVGGAHKEDKDIEVAEEPEVKSLILTITEGDNVIQDKH